MSSVFESQLQPVIDGALAALAAGGSEDFPLKEGRVVKVLASPSFDTAVKMAVGLAVLPPGYSTPPHSHEAEEIALVLRGQGTIRVAGIDVPVTEGSVVVAPPNEPHTTSSSPDGPLVVYWCYGPAGSESRWLGGGSA